MQEMIVFSLLFFLRNNHFSVGIFNEKKNDVRNHKKRLKNDNLIFKKNDVSVVGENNLPFWSFNS